jgi:hypothetical protein
MSLVLAAVLQAVSASPPERVDLTIRQPCQLPEASADEIVVCANRNGENPYRLQEMPPPEQAALPNAEVNVAEGVSVGAETEEADVGGFVSNRAMLRLKVKF